LRRRLLNNLLLFAFIFVGVLNRVAFSSLSMYIHAMITRRLLLSFALTCVTTVALAQAPAAPLPGGPTTKILAISHYTPGTDIAAVLPVLKEEVPATVRLYLDGKIDQWYYRTDQRGVVFILNCSTVEEAHALLEKLPLGQHHYMEFDLIPLGPLTPLKQLLQDKPAAAK
jgi:hypothetical protein